MCDRDVKQQWIITCPEIGSLDLCLVTSTRPPGSQDLFIWFLCLSPRWWPYECGLRLVITSTEVKRVLRRE